MPRYNYHEKHPDARRLAEDWTGLFDNGEVVRLYHHCRGTKFECPRYVTRLGAMDGQLRVAFGKCEGCGERPDDKIMIIIEIYNLRI